MALCLSKGKRHKKVARTTFFYDRKVELSYHRKGIGKDFSVAFIGVLSGHAFC